MLEEGEGLVREGYEVVYEVATRREFADLLYIDGDL